MKIKYVIMVLVIVVLVFYGYVTKVVSVEEVIVRYTDTGFIPAQITVHIGDSVIFENVSSKQMWPASNLHPSHLEYPEFDSQKPIAYGESWRFTFTKEGMWGYHDHLVSSQEAFITVIGSLGVADCGDGGNESCLRSDFESVFRTEGLDAAFSRMADVYASDPNFVQSCHGIAHALGVLAYGEYAKSRHIELTERAAYCGYGFYHGFMEVLLQKTGKPEEARDFCVYAQSVLYKKTIDALGACYHGIGHGAVDGGDPRAWGNATEIVRPALQLCQEITGEKDIEALGSILFRCVTGTYNGLEVLARDEKYLLEEINKNPFEFCTTQPASYQGACYTNMIPALLRLTKNNYEEAFEYVKEIPEVSGARYPIRPEIAASLAYEVVRENITHENYISRIVTTCRNLGKQLHLSCIEGLSGGHMKYGEPENEYKKALTFCGSTILTEDEKNVCYPYILSRLRIWYDIIKSRSICELVPKKYQLACRRQYSTL